METPLQAINRQIQTEKGRHNRVINDLNKQKERENAQYERTMRMLNNRKDQIKRYAKLENCFYTHCNNRRVTLEQMEEAIKKAMEDLG